MVIPAETSGNSLVFRTSKQPAVLLVSAVEIIERKLRSLCVSRTYGILVALAVQNGLHNSVQDQYFGDLQYVDRRLKSRRSSFVPQVDYDDCLKCCIESSIRISKGKTRCLMARLQASVPNPRARRLRQF